MTIHDPKLAGLKPAPKPESAPVPSLGKTMFLLAEQRAADVRELEINCQSKRLEIEAAQFDLLGMQGRLETARAELAAARAAIRTLNAGE